MQGKISPEERAIRIKSALYYANEMKYSVIPMGKEKGKVPLVLWEEFQQRIATDKEILDWFIKFPDANVGIITGKISGIVVIDVDSPEASAVLTDYIPDTISAPKVNTPRGGYHRYFAYPKDCELRSKNGILLNIDFKADGGCVVAPPSKNGNGKAYSWDPSLHIKNFYKDLPHIPDLFTDKIMQSLNSYSLEGGVVGGGDCVGVEPVLAEGIRNEQLFHVAWVQAKGGESKENVFNLLRILAKTCIPPYPEKELFAIVESAFQRLKKREFNVSAEVERFVTVTDGDFSVTDVVQAVTVRDSDKSVQTVTIRDSIRQSLKRLKEKGIIQKSGNKDGIYRKVNDTISEVDLFSEDKEGIDIAYPFQIEQLFITHPKNIIMVAGEKDAGKSAFLLNFAKINAEIGKYPITYFSSEMGEMELKSRIRKLSENGNIDDIWKKVKIKEKASDFAHFIDPNGINIIDFLEIYNEFYNIGNLIREIYDKLKNGIAVIAIQKNKGTDIGLGAERSREKARLYLAIERRNEGGERIKIVTAKNWRDDEYNPVGRYLNFKIYKGCKLSPEGGWMK